MIGIRLHIQFAGLQQQRIHRAVLTEADLHAAGGPFFIVAVQHAAGDFQGTAVQQHEGRIFVFSLSGDVYHSPFADGHGTLVGGLISKLVLFRVAVNVNPVGIHGTVLKGNGTGNDNAHPTTIQIQIGPTGDHIVRAAGESLAAL